MTAPHRGSLWIHANGAGPYTVMAIANIHGGIDHAPTVVYIGDNGRWWTKAVEDFLEKMSPTEASATK